MIKSLLLFSVILLFGSCSVQDNDLDYYTDTQQIKLICQVSVSTEKTDPLYALLLEGKYYKIDDFFKDIPISALAKVSILKGKKATAKYGASASYGAIELEYKPAYRKQLLAKNLEELTVTI